MLLSTTPVCLASSWQNEDHNSYTDGYQPISDRLVRGNLYIKMSTSFAKSTGKILGRWVISFFKMVNVFKRHSSLNTTIIHVDERLPVDLLRVYSSFQSFCLSLTLLNLNLSLSPSSTASRELLPQFSTCSG